MQQQQQHLILPIVYWFLVSYSFLLVQPTTGFSSCQQQEQRPLVVLSSRSNYRIDPSNPSSSSSLHRLYSQALDNDGNNQNDAIQDDDDDDKLLSSLLNDVLLQEATEEEKAKELEQGLSETLEQDNDDDDNDDESTTLSSSSSSLSWKAQRSKWKSKRYLMLRDVAKAIRRGDPSSPQKAQDALERIQEMQQQQQQQQNDDGDKSLLFEKDSKPLVQAYNLWIHAIAKTVPHNPGPQAEAVLNRMLLHNDDDDDGVVNVEPTIVTYTSVIDAYARSEKHDGALHAERILFGLLDQQLFVSENTKKQLRVTSVTCDAVLNAWARVGTLEAAQRALAILQRLEHLQNQQIRPTAHSYATVLNAFAKCHAPNHCQDILQDLVSKAKDHHNSAHGVVLPETVMFNVAMQAWANSGDPRAGNQAQKLLQHMLDLSSQFPTQPDTVSYNTVISAWAHSGHVNAALQAEKVLKQMHQASRQEQQQQVIPNTISYNSVLHAYAQAPTLPSSSSSLAPALRASRLLQFMIKSQNAQIAPDAISFTSVLNAWAKSKQPDKATQARHILDAFLAYRLEPNPIPFNAVLNACAFSAFDANNKASPEHTKREALRIAVSTFTLLRQQQDCQPDTVSYGNLLKCGANLMGMGDQRTELSMKVFAQCCRDGMVGELAWNEIRRAVPRNVLMQVVPSKLRPRGLAGIQHYDLPKSWRRNVSVRNRDKPRAKKPIKPQNKKKKKKGEQKSSPPIRREPRGFSEQLWTGKEI